MKIPYKILPIKVTIRNILRIEDSKTKMLFIYTIRGITHTIEIEAKTQKEAKKQFWEKLAEPGYRVQKAYSKSHAIDDSKPKSYPSKNKTNLNENKADHFKRAIKKRL